MKSRRAVRDFFSQRLNVLCIEDRIDICDLLFESILPSPILNVKPVNSPEGAQSMDDATAAVKAGVFSAHDKA